MRIFADIDGFDGPLHIANTNGWTFGNSEINYANLCWIQLDFQSTYLVDFTYEKITCKFTVWTQAKIRGNSVTLMANKLSWMFAWV